MDRITSRLGGGGEALLLVLLAGWSLIPLAVAVLHLIADGGVWSGVDGGGVIDHFNYLAWVREAGEHVAISNRSDVVADPAIYVQPQWVIGGLIAELTGSVQLGFLIFKPVAVALLFLGFAAYVRRLVEGRWARIAALALALFYWPVAAPLMAQLDLENGRGVVELFGYELAATNYVWGYFQTAISVGLMPVFLLSVEGLLDPSRRRRGARSAGTRWRPPPRAPRSPGPTRGRGSCCWPCSPEPSCSGPRPRAEADRGRPRSGDDRPARVLLGASRRPTRCGASRRRAGRGGPPLALARPRASPDAARGYPGLPRPAPDPRARPPEPDAAALAAGGAGDLRGRGPVVLLPLRLGPDAAVRRARGPRIGAAGRRPCCPRRGGGRRARLHDSRARSTCSTRSATT